MDEARKKFRICLICVVAAAVLTGMIYYFAECNAVERETEGTLVDRRWEAESGIEQ